METPPAEVERPSGQWPARIEKKVDDLCKRFEKVEDFLVGTLDSEGLVTRVKRIENDHGTRRRWFGVAVAAAITGAIASAWGWITHGGLSAP